MDQNICPKCNELMDQLGTSEGTYYFCQNCSDSTIKLEESDS